MSKNISSSNKCKHGRVITECSKCYNEYLKELNNQIENNWLEEKMDKKNKQKIEWIINTNVEDIFNKSIEDKWLKEHFNLIMMFKLSQLLERANNRAMINSQIIDSLILKLLEKKFLTPKETTKLYNN